MILTFSVGKEYVTVIVGVGRSMTLSSQVSPSLIFLTYSATILLTPTLQNIMWRYIVVDEGHRLKNTQCRYLSTTNTAIFLIILPLL